MDQKITQPELTSDHPFERAGLGKAPFRFAGVEEKTYCACPGADVQPGGSCQYCGNGIRYCFWVKSADDKLFYVGCDCIRKVDRNSKLLTEAERAEKQLKRAINRKADDARGARDAARLQEFALAVAFADTGLADRMAELPHPMEWAAQSGKTLLDYWQWMMANSGHSGRMRAMATIKHQLSLNPKEA
jgi:hypothetical protein